jgi:CheY-like chemotaxis protein
LPHAVVGQLQIATTLYYPAFSTWPATIAAAMNKLKLVGEGNVRANDKSRVLVVDDDLDCVQTMAMLVKMFGHEVAFAVNGLAAIDVARRFRPEVIVLDMNLPGINGDELARQLRFEAGLEKTRIIAVSGDQAARARALESGCAEFHVKPIAPDVLEKSLSTKTAMPPSSQTASGHL